MYIRWLNHNQKAHISTVLNLQLDVGKEAFRNAQNPVTCKKIVVTKIATSLNVIKPGCKSLCC